MDDLKLDIYKIIIATIFSFYAAVGIVMLIQLGLVSTLFLIVTSLVFMPLAFIMLNHVVNHDSKNYLLYTYKAALLLGFSLFPLFVAIVQVR